jgi:dynein heavy chain
MPRTQWIFKFSAQNTIVVSRTFFTQEVNEAFEELEEGVYSYLCVLRNG